MYSQGTTKVQTGGNSMEEKETGREFSDLLNGEGRSVCLLTVNTDVMEVTGICPGDVVAVDRTAAPVNNNIVVALLDGEMIIRKLAASGGKQWLETPGGKLAPLDVTGRLRVVGVVLYVIRKLTR